jgi:hypothetical protein
VQQQLLEELVPAGGLVYGDGMEWTKTPFGSNFIGCATTDDLDAYHN